MKNLIKTLLFTLLFLGSVVFTTTIFAQDVPPPPPPGGGHGGGGSLPPGGGTPIGEGMLILTALGAGYAARRWKMKQK